jgi:hypothetical protein
MTGNINPGQKSCAITTNKSESFHFNIFGLLTMAPLSSFYEYALI